MSSDRGFLQPISTEHRGFQPIGGERGLTAHELKRNGRATPASSRADSRSLADSDRSSVRGLNGAASFTRGNLVNSGGLGGMGGLGGVGGLGGLGGLGGVGGLATPEAIGSVRRQRKSVEQQSLDFMKSRTAASASMGRRRSGQNLNQTTPRKSTESVHHSQCRTKNIHTH